MSAAAVTATSPAADPVLPAPADVPARLDAVPAAARQPLAVTPVTLLALGLLLVVGAGGALALRPRRR